MGNASAQLGCWMQPMVTNPTLLALPPCDERLKIKHSKILYFISQFPPQNWLMWKIRPCWQRIWSIAAHYTTVGHILQCWHRWFSCAKLHLQWRQNRQMGECLHACRAESLWNLALQLSRAAENRWELPRIHRQISAKNPPWLIFARPASSSWLQTLEDEHQQLNHVHNGGSFA